MELDQQLQLARVIREVETRFKADLSRLPKSARKDVLMRLLLDVDADIDDENATAATRPEATATAATNGTQVQAQGDSIWRKVLAYCQSHPGTQHYVDVAEAVFPERMTSESREVFLSTISTVLRRRCVNKRDAKGEPYFRWLKDGKFRLATDEERARALAKRESAKKD